MLLNERGLEGAEPYGGGQIPTPQRTTDGSQNDTMSLVDCAQVLRSVVRDCEGQLDAKRLTVVYHPPSRCPILRASPSRLYRVFERLLHHAIVSTPRGGTITLRARCREEGAFGVEILERTPRPAPEEPPVRRLSPGQRSRRTGDSSPPGLHAGSSSSGRLNPDATQGRERYVHHFDTA